MLEAERLAKVEAQVESLKEDVKDARADIKELHSRITTTTREITDHIDRKIDHLAQSDADQHKVMTEKIDKINSRVNILERWRFMIVGGAIALGYLIAHMDLFSKIFK